VRIEVDEEVAKAKERLDTFLSRRITILSRSSLNRSPKPTLEATQGQILSQSPTDAISSR